MEKQNIDPYIMLYININMKGIIDLHLRPKTVKILKENREKSHRKFSCPWIRQRFLKRFLLKKKKTTDWRKIYAKHISHKGLVLRKYNSI
jgi:hypothetical protein